MGWTWRVPAAAGFDEGEVRRALLLFADPDLPLELRGLPSGRSRVRLGSDLDGLAAAAAGLADDRGVYWCLNPCDIPPGTDGVAASAGNVVRRRWLLVDVDPERPADVSSTDAEKAAALAVAGGVRGWLSSLGWPEPVLVDSGNGYHLLYRVDLPNDEESRLLVKAVLAAAADRHDSAGARVDRKVFNASRVSKLPGTWARKGPDDPGGGRPHRPALVVSAPARPGVVTAAMLRAAAPAPAPPAPPAPGAGKQGLVGTAVGGPGKEAYARKALLEEVGKVASCRHERNNQLNDSAFRLGTLVGAGLLPEAEVADCLRRAAGACGLAEDPNCGPRGVEATLRSGLEAGKQEPRQVPERAGPDGAGPAGKGQAAGDLEADLNGAPDLSPGDVATVDDLIEAGANISWLWDGWLPLGVLTVVAAEAGTGKTRFCADLIRRVRFGLPWPDGAEVTARPSSLALWVMADNHHDQLVSVSQAFGIKENCRINAYKSDPYGGVTLDEREDLVALERRIRAVRPLLVVVDTVGNATDRNLSRQEDAKAFYQPLQIIARRHRVAVVCVTHLNANGAVLGRRVMEKARVVVRMSMPDPGQPNRRRLEVIKSFDKYPPALGVTMGEHGNDYDRDPPQAPEEGGGESRPAASPGTQKAMAWLARHLAAGRKRVSITRDAAEAARISSKTLYAAKKALGVKETESEGKKWWELTFDDDGDGGPVSAVSPF